MSAITLDALVAALVAEAPAGFTVSVTVDVATAWRYLSVSVHECHGSSVVYAAQYCFGKGADAAVALADCREQLADFANTAKPAHVWTAIQDAQAAAHDEARS